MQDEWIRIRQTHLPPPITAVYRQRGTKLNAAHIRLNKGAVAYRVTSSTGRSVVWSQKANGRWEPRLAAKEGVKQ